ncbi:hypothetical protein M5G07_11975 [Serratia symbiotica]|nr:hypothetical protein [Serratia symbiotica]
MTDLGGFDSALGYEQLRSYTGEGCRFVYIKLNNVMTFIDLSGEELFYEMGITVDSMESLKQATASDSLAPVHKFWVLDRLVFSELKDGVSEQIAQWLEAMEALLAKHTFGYKERTAYTMKRMLFYPKRGKHL